MLITISKLISLIGGIVLLHSLYSAHHFKSLSSSSSSSSSYTMASSSSILLLITQSLNLPIDILIEVTVAFIIILLGISIILNNYIIINYKYYNYFYFKDNYYH